MSFIFSKRKSALETFSLFSWQWPFQLILINLMKIFCFKSYRKRQCSSSVSIVHVFVWHSTMYSFPGIVQWLCTWGGQWWEKARGHAFSCSRNIYPFFLLPPAVSRLILLTSCGLLILEVLCMPSNLLPSSSFQSTSSIIFSQSHTLFFLSSCCKTILIYNISHMPFFFSWACNIPHFSVSNLFLTGEHSHQVPCNLGIDTFTPTFYHIFIFFLFHILFLKLNDAPNPPDHTSHTLPAYSSTHICLSGITNACI